MNFIRQIAVRELRSVMYSATGVFIVVLYLALAGYVFALNVSLTQVATLRHTFSTLCVLTIFVVPLITMRLISEELRTGTFEALVAHPVTDIQIVLGKFIAGVAVFAFMFTPTLLYLVILQIFGSPDWGPALAGYFGQLLLASVLTALGLLISSLTHSQVLAAMGAMVGGVIFWLAGTASYTVRGSLGDALAYLAMLEHYAVFRRGIIDSRSLVYFLATTTMLLYLAVRSIESRRWKFGVTPGGVPQGWHQPKMSLTLAALAFVCLGEAIISSLTFGYWRLYSFVLVFLAIVLFAIPVYLNLIRLRYELSRRQTGLAMTVFLNCLLVIVLWSLVTFVASRHYVRLDLTRNKRYALSELTETTLRQLEQPVEFIAAVNQPTDLRQEIVDLLAEYAARTKQVSYREVDVERDPGQASMIREQYGLTSALGNEVLVVFGEEVRRVPIGAMVNRPMRIVDNRRVRGPVQFVGEAEITAALLQMQRDSPGRVVFLAGRGERNPNDTSPEGASFVADELRRNGWVVAEHVTAPGSMAQFPEDTAAVVVSSPQRRLADEDITALNTFLDQGGGVLALVEPGVDSGLEPLIEPWNARLGDNIVVDLQSHVASADPTSLSVRLFRSDHPIGKGMGSLSAVMPNTRRVAVTHTNLNPHVTSTNFMHTSDKGWAITYQPGTRLSLDPRRDRRGPISLGLAAERYQPSSTPGELPKTGRMVVIGGVSWLTNRYVDMAGNLDLFLNSVDWLAGRQELISVRPKVTNLRRMNLTRAQAKSIFWISVLGMPGGVLISGVAVVLKRRRGK